MRMTSQTLTASKEWLHRWKRAPGVRKVRVRVVPAAAAIVIVIADGAVAAVRVAVQAAVREVTLAATPAAADAEEGKHQLPAPSCQKVEGPQRCGPFLLGRILER